MAIMWCMPLNVLYELDKHVYVILSKLWMMIYEGQQKYRVHHLGEIWAIFGRDLVCLLYACSEGVGNDTYPANMSQRKRGVGY